VRKFLCSLVLLAAVGVLVASVSLAPAQQNKKDEKKDDKTAEPGGIEVYQAKDGWRFRVTNAEGKSIAIGTQGFAKKEDCLAAVELLKTTMAKAKITEVPKDEKK
jgi:uncharacterized protein YegP (UPF0339 family)